MKFEKLLGNLHIFNAVKNRLNMLYKGNFLTIVNAFRMYTDWSWEYTYEMIHVTAENVISELNSKQIFSKNYGVFRSFYKNLDGTMLKRRFTECLIIDVLNIRNSAGIRSGMSRMEIAAKLRQFVSSNPNYKCGTLATIYIRMNLNYLGSSDISLSTNSFMSKVTVVMQAFAGNFTFSLFDQTNWEKIIEQHNSKYGNASSFKDFKVNEITWDEFPTNHAFFETLATVPSQEYRIDYGYINVNNSQPALFDYVEYGVKVEVIKNSEPVATLSDGFLQMSLNSDGVDMYTIAFNKALCLRPKNPPAFNENVQDRFLPDDIEQNQNEYLSKNFNRNYLDLFYVITKVKKILGENSQLLESHESISENVESSDYKIRTTCTYHIDLSSKRENCIVASLMSGVAITNYGMPGPSSGSSGSSGPSPKSPSGGSGPKGGGSSNPSNPSGSPESMAQAETSPEASQAEGQNQNENVTESQLESFPLNEGALDVSLAEMVNDGEISLQKAQSVRSKVINGVKDLGVKSIKHLAVPILIGVVKQKLGSDSSLVNVQQHITNKLMVAEEVNFENSLLPRPKLKL